MIYWAVTWPWHCLPNPRPQVTLKEFGDVSEIYIDVAPNSRLRETSPYHKVSSSLHVWGSGRVPWPTQPHKTLRGFGPLDFPTKTKTKSLPKQTKEEEVSNFYLFHKMTSSAKLGTVLIGEHWLMRDTDQALPWTRKCIFECPVRRLPAKNLHEHGLYGLVSGWTFLPHPDLFREVSFK